MLGANDGIVSTASLIVGVVGVESLYGRHQGNFRVIADLMVGHAQDGLHHWLNLTLAAGGMNCACCGPNRTIQQ